MKHIFYLFLFAVLVFSCAKEDVVIDERVPAYFPVQSKTVGRVLDQNGTPITDASVELNGFTAATNSLGLFNFDDMELNGAGTNITVRKLGYFNAFRTFIPNIPTISSVTIYMIERPSSGSFQSNVGGTISVNGGGSVTFLPNSIITASGAPYTGEVVVSAFWIDPTDVNGLSVMPGDLRGFSLEGDRVQLATYGMMVVELESPTGEPLNIGNGMTATLTFPVSSSLLGSAPAVIPLWSFNETTGYWEEEGTADIVGNNYVAEVSHFTWYSTCGFDIPINVEVTVKNSNGDPVAGANLNFNDPFSLYQGFGDTNNRGIAFAYIQSGKELSLSASHPSVSSCQVGGYYTETVGPFEEFFGWERIMITLDPPIDVTKTVNITGNFFNCDGNLVTNGVLLVDYQTFPINPDGTIDISINSCKEELEISVYDFIAQTEAQLGFYQIPNNLNEISIADISICNSLDEFITINYDSEDFTFVEPWHTASFGEGSQFMHLLTGNVNINQDFKNVWISWETANSIPTTGTTNQVVFEYTTPSVALLGSITIEVSIYDIPGYIQGNYSGNVSKLVNGQTSPSDVSGTFRVRTQ